MTAICRRFLVLAASGYLLLWCDWAAGQCPGGRCPSCGPGPQPMVLVPPVRPVPRPPPARAAGGSRYLPPMPEMLRPASAATGRPQPAGSLSSPSRPAGQPVVRAQDASGADRAGASPRPKVSIPTPEELGLVPASSPASPSAASPDWAAVRQILEQAGATHYRLERLQDGWRFVCSLPDPDQPHREHQIEVHADSDAAAMSAVAAQVRSWLSRRDRRPGQ